MEKEKLYFIVYDNGFQEGLYKSMEEALKSLYAADCFIVECEVIKEHPVVLKEVEETRKVEKYVIDE